MQASIQTEIVADTDLLGKNGELAEKLALIGSYYAAAKDIYRTKAFNTAAMKIAQYPGLILSGAQARAELKGIGDSIEEAIDQYLTTGRIQRLEELEQKFIDRKATIDYFISFYGIGPVSANKFYDQGLRTLEDLYFKGNLTDAQKIGIQWREHIGLRIPRWEMDIINNILGSILNPYNIKWTIAGSYRREEPDSGDIDVLVEARPDLDMYGLVALLKPILPAILAQGPSATRAIIRISDEYNGHRIDLRIIAPAQYPFALMYFTGSQRFNILMRQRAIELGLTLNEYGLYRQGPAKYQLPELEPLRPTGLTLQIAPKPPAILPATTIPATTARPRSPAILPVTPIVPKSPAILPVTTGTPRTPRITLPITTPTQPESLPATSEEDIFNHLRVRYMAPVERTKTLATLPTY